MDHFLLFVLRTSRCNLRLLLQSLWLDIWKTNGISVQSLGNHETAARLFTEVGSWMVYHQFFVHVYPALWILKQFDLVMVSLHEDVMEVEQLHAEDMVQVQKRYKALDLPVGQLDDQKWVMQLASVIFECINQPPINHQSTPGISWNCARTTYHNKSVPLSDCASDWFCGIRCSCIMRAARWWYTALDT